jgi:uncharacterized protein
MSAMRIAALGDLHVRESTSEGVRQVFAGVHEHADVVALSGDLTDRGQPREAEALAQALAVCRIPVLGVLGNHDCDSGQMEEIRRILTRAGLTMLEVEPRVIDGVGFAGAKGFAGGFDNHILQPWGEEIVKRFVQETVNEALLLEGALARLQTEQGIQRSVAVLHYAPIRATVEGEPPEIIPFLGSSRLVDAVDRFGVVAVIHAHAHHGSPQGSTPKGTPVYNVSLPVLRRTDAETAFKIIEI